MRKNGVVLSSVLALCVSSALFVGCAPASSTDDGTPTPTGPTPTPTAAAGTHITSNTTWSGAVAMTDDTIVDAGVTLTISAGTTITATANKSLQISGTLVAEGTATGSATPTIFDAASGTWGGISVVSGGIATMTNVEIRHAFT